MNLSISLVTSFALSLALAGGAAARDPKAASEAVHRAELAMAGQRYAEAAEAMEHAFQHDPNPLWLANAGYAHMMAGDSDKAVDDLSRALADAKLTGEARTRASERIELALAAQATVTRARVAREQDDFIAAGEAYDGAFAIVTIGPYRAEAAAMYERAGKLELAAERFREAAAQQDLTPSRRVEVVEGLTRVTNAIARPKKPEDPGEPKEPERPAEVERASAVPAWIVIGSGAAVLGVGVAGFLISEGKRSAWDGATRDAEGFITSLDEAEARELESDARTWWTVGLVATTVGVAAAATGVVLLVTRANGPETRGSVEVGGVPLSGGGLVTAMGRF